ncbi:unnamed protein product [Tilletia controversa]|uniref:Uncharacterized protein n=3 Tax=Tilletia TaxID=13289 RepID=A0A8X7SVV3_9BASI|nr:hypothetical protein CF335_g5515 [Tilletia laevis]KAE8246190.1 hypothetical protein A4X06_0g5124 [Tilletia controversa]KAE8265055.1 hypothetical protein A4X03_0g525 [Tilletia caries]KAE8200197.1 hypothetical protein CF336_g814 [Tilletia laevis]CAD6888894.1 unnamed protein product [Tilletia caries]
MTPNEQETGVAKLRMGIQGAGVDVQNINGLPADNDAFIQRNFTPTEIYQLPTPEPTSAAASLPKRLSSK